MDLDLITARIEVLEKQITHLTETMNKLQALLERFEGAGSLVKFLFYIITPIVATIVWSKDHIKF